MGQEAVRIGRSGGTGIIGLLRSVFIDSEEQVSYTAAEGQSRARIRLHLFLTSFLILFFELICIRWLGAYVRYLSYFANFVLLASFLGAGVGILAGRRRNLRFPSFPLLLLALVGLVAFAKLDIHVASSEVLFYEHMGTEESRWRSFIVLPLFFTLVALTFVPLARPLGRLLSSLPPLEAYATDILGSMAGVAAFFLISWFSLPPVVWFAVLTLALLPLIPFPRRVLSAGLLALAIVPVVQISAGDIWSPYYRIQVTPTPDYPGVMINVNNVGHQEASAPEHKHGFYFRAYDLFGTKPFERVLVLGAGSGSDVAIALANGARHVDAVEIDPRIAQIGRRHHPSRPFDDPRVTLHTADGREFLRTTKNRYDLIVFALPDSLTLTSGFSSLRLESFLLTADSLRDARERLTDNGLVVLYNFYRETWLVQKLASMAADAFGEAPYVTTYGTWGRAAVLMAGPRLKELPASLNVPYASARGTDLPHRGIPLPVIGHGRFEPGAFQVLATDNWPFVYLPFPTVPGIYLAALAMASLVALLMTAGAAPRGTLRRFDWHFFFLGCAFMLLETRSLVTFSLLFGSTWMVNSLVFFAILGSVLLAIVFNARFRVQRVWPLYVLLFGTLALNYFLPPRTLLDIDLAALRYPLASLMAFAPIFLANVIFTRSFRDTGAADIAFASNLLGIMVGGFFEYMALATGYQALLIAVAAFYWLAMRCGRSRPADGAAEEAARPEPESVETAQTVS